MKRKIVSIVFAVILCLVLVPESKMKAAELETEWSEDDLVFVDGKAAGDVILSSVSVPDIFINPLMPNETTHYNSSTAIWTKDHKKIVVRVWQFTEWSYAPGISSTLTNCVVSYSELLDGYSVMSGGDTITTNNDGTQQVASYFRIVDPQGNISLWYKIVAVCSVNGVVSVSADELPY